MCKEEQAENLFFEHLLNERNAFMDEIRQLTPEQIIARAYEISIKNDFYFNITEVSDFEPHELRALATLDNPLTACYERWSARDNSGFNEKLRACIEEVIASKQS